MNIYKSLAIVCRSIKYSETSIIVDLYTREKGMRSFIISGIRSRKGRRSASYFQLMTLLEVVAYDRTDGKLARLKEFRLAHHYIQLPFDVQRSSIGTFMLEVTRNCLVSDEQHTELFDFLCSDYQDLDRTSEPIANRPLRFLLALSEHLGFLPDNRYAAGSYFDLVEGRFVHQPISAHYTEPDIAHLIDQLLSHDPWTITITKGQRSTILQTLIDYYRLHLDHFKPLKSLPILREIL